jgi:hypothetical protein
MGMVVTFEAMAASGIICALSPQPKYVHGCTYEIHFASNNNLRSCIQRELSTGGMTEKGAACRVCDQRSWVKYWIVAKGGLISIGVGEKVGESMIQQLDDSVYDQLRPGQDAVAYVGFGNSTSGRSSHEVKVRRVVVASPSTELIVGPEKTPFVQVSSAAFGTMEGGTGFSAELSESMFSLYEEECERNKQRAEKFGTEYVEPDTDAFLKWSEAKRLRENPQAGFITGIDTTSSEEKKRRDDRKARFKTKRKNVETGEDMTAEEEAAADAAEEDERAATEEELKQSELPIIQAWDNDLFYKEFRVDGILTEAPSAVANIDNACSMEGNDDDAVLPTLEKGMEQRNEIEDAENISSAIVTAESDPDDASLSTITAATAAADVMTTDAMSHTDNSRALVELDDRMQILEKVHIFSLDYAAFKQIRSNDIMSHFRDFGPSYVEWLGEFSANILFEDEHSATRALMHFTNSIPSPPPYDLLEHGESATDFGAKEWRFSKHCMEKKGDDRWGRRGTMCRYLARVATSQDSLSERVTQWPPRPPNFSTTKVYGPGGVILGGQQQQNNNNNNNNNYNNNYNNNQQQQNGNRNNGGQGRKRKGGGGGGGGRGYNDADAEDNYNYSSSSNSNNSRNRREEDKAPAIYDPQAAMNGALGASRGGNNNNNSSNNNNRSNASYNDNGNDNDNMREDRNGNDYNEQSRKGKKKSRKQGNGGGGGSERGGGGGSKKDFDPQSAMNGALGASR